MRRWPPGSSTYALGTDSGGSIRIPAACCGVVGFKPSFGLVPLDGCFPLTPSFDHAGPMARDVDGCERMMEALVPGYEPVEVSLGDLRVGVAWTERADPLVRERVEAVAAGFERVEVPWPDGVYPGLLARDRRGPRRPVPGQPRSLRPGHRDQDGQARRVTDAEVAAALAERERYRERIAALEVDLLVTPHDPDGRAAGRASATSRCASG